MFMHYFRRLAIPGGSDSEESACYVGDPGSLPGLGRSSGEGNAYPLLYSCLENSMDRETWCARAHGVTKSWTPLNGLTLSLESGTFLK